MKNNQINYVILINNVIIILRELCSEKDGLIINKTLKEHSISTSCLKIFKYSIFDKIICYLISKFQKKINSQTNIIMKNLYIKYLITYLENIDKTYKIIYNYDDNRLLEVLKQLEIKILTIKNN